MSAIVVGNARYTTFQQKLIGLAFQNLYRCSSGKSRHVSFIVKKNKILVMGWNFENKSHPLARKYFYYNAAVHSELHCVSRFPKHHADFGDCDLWNLRINRYNEIKMSKPCRHCQRLLLAFNLKSVYYTTDDGSFERFY